MPIADATLRSPLAARYISILARVAAGGDDGDGYVPRLHDRLRASGYLAIRLVREGQELRTCVVLTESGRRELGIG